MDNGKENTVRYIVFRTTMSAKGRFVFYNEAQSGSGVYYERRDALSPSVPQIRSHNRRSKRARADLRN